MKTNRMNKQHFPARALTVYFMFLFTWIVTGAEIMNFVKKEKNPYLMDNIYVWNQTEQNLLTPNGIKLIEAEYKTYTTNNGILKLGANQMVPYIDIGKDLNQAPSGFFGEIWKIMNEVLKYNYTVEPMEYDVGIEKLLKQELDVFLAAVVRKSPQESRSQPYMNNWYHLYQKTHLQKASSNSYLKTFHGEVWKTALLIFLTISLCLYCTCIILKRKRLVGSNVSLLSCLVTAVSGFLGQAYDIHTRDFYSVRIQIFFASMFGYLVSCAFNASLVAKFAVTLTSMPFDNLEMLADVPEMNLCVRTNSFVYNHFTDDKKSILPKWRKVVNGPKCLDINNYRNICEIICEDNVVILENRAVMALVLNENLECEVISSHEKLFYTGNYIGFSKRFLQKHKIKSLSAKLEEYGLINRLEQEWITSKKQQHAETNHEPFTLDHIKGLLIFYFGCIIFSVSLMGLEVLYARYQEEKRVLQLMNISESFKKVDKIEFCN